MLMIKTEFWNKLLTADQDKMDLYRQDNHHTAISDLFSTALEWLISINSEISNCLHQ